MRVGQGGNVKGVLTCWTSHCVSGQYTHRITHSPLPFALKGFQRYCLRQDNFCTPNRDTASIWSYDIFLSSQKKLFSLSSLRKTLQTLKQPSSGCILSVCLHQQLQKVTSATTLVYVRNTWVFRIALTALMEPRTLWRRIKHLPLNTYFLYIAPGMWWPKHTIRTTRVLHSSHGLQLCCSCLHNTWQCLCLSSANSHILPLSYCYISDAALSPYMFSIRILSLTAIKSLLRIHRLPLHLLGHYHIL